MSFNLKEVSSKFNQVVQPLTDLPTPSSVSYMWNFGSLLGLCLTIQLISGIFLSFHYHSSVGDSFTSVLSLEDEVYFGWLVRSFHANGASFFFIFLYMHLGRGLYYGSYYLHLTWMVGVLLLFLLMGTAFLGYVLPWGQMSFWGATVITNLLSAFPMGDLLVQWVWGGFSVGGPTLSRFFSLHYVMPFVVLLLVLFHITLLHETGSSNPLGVSGNSSKVYFHPPFSWKDLVGVVVFLFLFGWTVIYFPDFFMDPDNFTPANPMSTPPHIQPEWYFLFAYAILRSVPSKLGGVLALILSIGVMFLLPLMSKGVSVCSCRFNVWKKVSFWGFCGSVFLLTWVGSMPAEGVMVMVGQFLSVLYFTLLLLLSIF